MSDSMTGLALSSLMEVISVLSKTRLSAVSFLFIPDNPGTYTSAELFPFASLFNNCFHLKTNLDITKRHSVLLVIQRS